MGSGILTKVLRLILFDEEDDVVSSSKKTEIDM